MYLTLRKTTLILKLSTSVLFYRVFLLGVQQNLLQNLINYIGNFNTAMLDRVNAMEVSATLLHDG